MRGACLSIHPLGRNSVLTFLFSNPSMMPACTVGSADDHQLLSLQLIISFTILTRETAADDDDEERDAADERLVLRSPVDLCSFPPSLALSPSVCGITRVITKPSFTTFSVTGSSSLALIHTFSSTQAKHGKGISQKAITALHSVRRIASNESKGDHGSCLPRTYCLFFSQDASDCAL